MHNLTSIFSKYSKYFKARRRQHLVSPAGRAPVCTQCAQTWHKELRPLGQFNPQKSPWAAGVAVCILHMDELDRSRSRPVTHTLLPAAPRNTFTDVSITRSGTRLKFNTRIGCEAKRLPCVDVWYWECSSLSVRCVACRGYNQGLWYSKHCCWLICTRSRRRSMALLHPVHYLRKITLFFHLLEDLIALRGWIQKATHLKNV